MIQVKNINKENNIALIFIVRFEKDNSIIKEWVLEGNEDLEKSLIEMLDIDFQFINKIRGFKK